MSTFNENVLEQLSIRIDNIYDEMTEVKEEILRLRDRSHEMETTLPVIVASVDKFVDKNADQMMAIFEKQKKLDDALFQSLKEQSLKIADIEKVTNGIKLVATHWKSLIVVAIIFAVLGFTFEKGIKDIVVALLPDKAVKAAQVIANG